MIKFIVLLVQILTNSGHMVMGKDIPAIPTDSLSVIVDIPDTLDDRTINTSILFHITNNSTSPIVIRDPHYWENAIPEITHNGEPINACFRIKAMRENEKKKITLNPKESKTIRYLFGAEKLFCREYRESGVYKIHFILSLDENTRLETTAHAIYVEGRQENPMSKQNSDKRTEE